MTLYDSLLLLGAHWRGLLLLPLVSGLMAYAVMLMWPPEQEVKVALYVGGKAVRVVPLLVRNGFVVVVPKDDPESLDITLRTTTGQDLVRTVETLRTAVNAYDSRRRRDIVRVEAALVVIKKQAHHWARQRDYDIALQERERLRDGLPRSHLEPLRLLTPIPRVSLLWHRIAVAIAMGFVAAICGVFVQAWWRAESALRRQASTARQWKEGRE